MRTLELKQELHKQIESLDRSHLNYLYGQIRNLLKGQIDESHWNNMTEMQKNGIDEAIKQTKEGKVVSNERVMKKIKERYGLS